MGGRPAPTTLDEIPLPTSSSTTQQLASASATDCEYRSGDRPTVATYRPPPGPWAPEFEFVIEAVRLKGLGTFREVAMEWRVLTDENSPFSECDRTDDEEFDDANARDAATSGI